MEELEKAPSTPDKILVEKWLLEYCLKYGYQNSVSEFLSMPGTPDLEDYNISPAYVLSYSITTAVNNDDVQTYPLVLEILDHLLNDHDNLIPYRVYAKLTTGLKILVLFDMLKRGDKDVLRRTKMYFPRKEITHPKASESLLQRLNTDKWTFRYFFVPLIGDKERREGYLKRRYLDDFGRELPGRVKSLAQRVSSLVHKNVKTDLELVMHNPHSLLVEELEGLDSVSMQILLDNVLGKRDLIQREVSTIFCQLRSDNKEDSPAEIGFRGMLLNTTSDESVTTPSSNKGKTSAKHRPKASGAENRATLEENDDTTRPEVLEKTNRIISTVENKNKASKELPHVGNSGKTIEQAIEKRKAQKRIINVSDREDSGSEREAVEAKQKRLEQQNSDDGTLIDSQEAEAILDKVTEGIEVDFIYRATLNPQPSKSSDARSFKVLRSKKSFGKMYRMKQNTQLNSQASQEDIAVEKTLENIDDLEIIENSLPGGYDRNQTGMEDKKSNDNVPLNISKLVQSKENVNYGASQNKNNSAGNSRVQNSSIENSEKSKSSSSASVSLLQGKQTAGSLKTVSSLKEHVANQQVDDEAVVISSDHASHSREVIEISSSPTSSSSPRSSTPGSSDLGATDLPPPSPVEVGALEAMLLEPQSPHKSSGNQADTEDSSPAGSHPEGQLDIHHEGHSDTHPESHSDMHPEQVHTVSSSGQSTGAQDIGLEASQAQGEEPEVTSHQREQPYGEEPCDKGEEYGDKGEEHQDSSDRPSNQGKESHDQREELQDSGEGPSHQEEECQVQMDELSRLEEEAVELLESLTGSVQDIFDIYLPKGPHRRTSSRRSSRAIAEKSDCLDEGSTSHLAETGSLENGISDSDIASEFSMNIPPLGQHLKNPTVKLCIVKLHRWHNNLDRKQKGITYQIYH